MKTIYTKLLMLLMLASITVSVSAQVSLTATAGTTSGSYATLSAAFGNINNGTHQGDIVISITANTIEPANNSDTLYSTSTLSASYTSVLIRPTTDGVSISGSPTQGRGVIELFGADNVTIDGDNPNTSGTNRNLSIISVSAGATTFGSVIRLATSVANASLASCDNNTIKNCIVTGYVVGNLGNFSTATSSAASVGSSFGIFAGSDSSTATSNATKLQRIATTSQSMANTTSSITPTCNNLLITNNKVNCVGRAIQFAGNGTNCLGSNQLTITNNVIGSDTTLTGTPSTAVPMTTIKNSVYQKGIIIAGANNFSVNGNTIQNMASFVSGASTSGIEISSANLSTGTVLEVRSNNISNLYLNNASGSVRGILLNSSNTIPVITSGNTITNIQTLGGSGAVGIDMGTGVPNCRVDKNSITKIYCPTVSTGSLAIGIRVQSSNDTVSNNFISDVLSCFTSGAFATSNGSYGILCGGTPTTGRIYNNSVYLTGNLLGTTVGSGKLHLTAAMVLPSSFGSGFGTGWDIRNNIFVNTISTGRDTSNAHVCVWYPAAASATAILTMNNNAYYCGSNSLSQGVAFVGTTALSIGTNLTYLPGNFNAGPAAPGATNIRAYSSTLSSAATNDNASFASTAAAPFVSATNLHISSSVAATASQLESGGASIGITTDIDGDARPNGAAADMGADEFTGVMLDVTPPSVTISTLTNECDPALSGATSKTLSGVTITDATGVSSSALPRIYYKKGINGSYSSAAGTKTAGTFQNGTWSFTISYTGLGLANGDSVYYFIVAQDAATTPNVGTTPAGGVFTDVNTGSTYPTPNFYTARTLSGTYNVGTGFTGQGFSTIDAAIKAYNTSCLNGAVTFSLINSAYNLANGSDTITANSNASATNTLTIKPTLANTVINASPASTTAVFFLQGADYIIIDGSISSTANSICSPTTRASRDLTIRNNTVGFSGNAGAVIWLGTNTAVTDAPTNNKIINCNLTGSKVSGGDNIAYQLCGVGSGGPTVAVSTTNLGNGNNNNQFINDSISLCATAVYTIGASAANPNTGTVINQIITAKSPNNVCRGGISANFENNITVSGNTINAVDVSYKSSPSANYGISLGYGPGNTNITYGQTSGNSVTNATVTKNLVDSMVDQNPGQGIGSGFVGIYLATGATGTSTITNNRVRGIAVKIGMGGSTDVNSGIHICGGASTVNIYHNTINIGNAAGLYPFGASESVYGISIANISPTINLKNNVVSVTASVIANRNRAIGLGYALPATNLTSNNNDFYVTDVTDHTITTASAIGQTGTLSTTGSTLHTTLANWQTNASQDANSVNVVPVFVSSTDLHLAAGSNCTLSGAGAAGLVSDDMDCQARTSNDIGADEFTPAVSISTATTTVCANASTMFTATATNTASPSYQWKKNGNNVGTNSTTYSDAALANNDVIACVITVSGACAATATSSNITMTVNPNVTPSVSISTATTSVCSGNSVAFTATGNNAGSSPVYTWKKNGSSVGSSSAITFLAGTLTSGDIINCALTANNTCQTSTTANSNNDTMTVKTSPAIGTSTGGTICNLSTVLGVYNSNPNSGIWSSSNTGIATVATSNGATGLVTGVSNGMATLTYTKTGSNGCVSAASATVIVAVAATPNAVTGTNSICRGSTTQLSSTTTGGVWAASPTSYATINSTGLLTSTSTGTSLVKYTVTNANGCSAAANYTVTINSFPNVPSIGYAAGTTNPQYGSGGAFCANKTFTVAGSPSGGVWSKTGVISVGSSSGIVNTGAIAGAGSLTYTYTNANLCSSSRTIAGNVAICASRGVNGVTNEKETRNEFVIYPNPAKTFIRLNVYTLIGAGSIVVTDLYGKQAKVQPLSLGNNTIDLTTLTKGIYMVSVITSEGKTTKKLIVE